MLSFDDFDAWSDAIRGADLGLVCDGVEVRSWRLAVRSLGRVVVQTAFEGAAASASAPIPAAAPSSSSP